jgi:hypothetical protein
MNLRPPFAFKPFSRISPAIRFPAYPDTLLPQFRMHPRRPVPPVMLPLDGSQFRRQFRVHPLAFLIAHF